MNPLQKKSKNQKKSKSTQIKLAKLKKQADEVFSKWIRERDKRCYTCITGKAEQAGHYVSRSYHYLRYDERNVHGQCTSCNIFKKGNLDVYAIRLIAQYGTEILYEFNRTKNLRIENPRKFYQEIIKKYGSQKSN